jgi:putative transposase
VPVEFALYCYVRETMGHVATIGGITTEDVQDLTVAAVEIGMDMRQPIEWLADNGSCYNAAPRAPSPGH